MRTLHMNDVLCYKMMVRVNCWELAYSVYMDKPTYCVKLFSEGQADGAWYIPGSILGSNRFIVLVLAN